MKKKRAREKNWSNSQECEKYRPDTGLYMYKLNKQKVLEIEHNFELIIYNTYYLRAHTHWSGESKISVEKFAIISGVSEEASKWTSRVKNKKTRGKLSKEKNKTWKKVCYSESLHQLRK